jgi:hypothetical protein
MAVIEHALAVYINGQALLLFMFAQVAALRTQRAPLSEYVSVSRRSDLQLG